MIRYLDDSRQQGVMLPSRVERRVGDNPPEVFRIESLDPIPAFPEENFRIDY